MNKNKTDFDDAVFIDNQEPMLEDNLWGPCDECGNVVIHKDTCSKNKEVRNDKK